MLLKKKISKQPRLSHHQDYSFYLSFVENDFKRHNFVDNVVRRCNFVDNNFKRRNFVDN